MALTPQEVFTTVKTHLLTQYRQAKLTNNPESMCAYLADDGAQCAAGCLIPSNLYEPEMEQKSIDKVFKRPGRDLGAPAMTTTRTAAQSSNGRNRARW